MTVERGQPWGHPAPLPEGAVLVRSDAAAREVVEAARRAGEPPPVLGLLGGDLCRTLGGRGDEARLHSDEAMTMPVDLGSVLIDGRLHWFVAHLVAARSWWRGPAVVAMNAQFLGAWDVAPRSHPNDGRLDVITLDPERFGWRDRWMARSRLPAGRHLPHPGLTERRVQAVQLELAAPTPVRLDGVDVGLARQLSIRVEPDAVMVVV